jgi:hypothetical protein
MSSDYFHSRLATRVVTVMDFLKSLLSHVGIDLGC